MSSLKIETLQKIINLCSFKIEDFKVFVETGTLNGGTILPMSEHFDNLFTIELSDFYYNNFNKKNYNKEKIKSILGDSSKIFPELLQTINKNTIFFLDGHYSSDNTAKGEKDCPLIEEIQSINDFFKNEAIIIIDDLRLFNTKLQEDWTYITKESVSEPIKNRIIDMFEDEDRLVISIKPTVEK